MDKEPDQECSPQPDDRSSYMRYAKYGAAITIGVAAPVVAVPTVLSAAGFGATGIAAGSLGAKMMSVSATTGFGATLVGLGQSIGAAGMAWSSTIGLSSIGAWTGMKVAEATEKKTESKL